MARYEIAHGGFRCSGIYPFNKHIFSDLDYLASDMTNIPLEDRAKKVKINHTNYSSLFPKGQQEQHENLPSDLSDSNVPQTFEVRLEHSVGESNSPATTSHQILVPKSPQPSTSKGLGIQQISAHKSPELSTSKGIDFMRKAILNISPVPDAAKKRAQVRNGNAKKVKS